MTEKALDGSIEHWKRLRDGTTSSDEGISAYDCDLCKVYLDAAGGNVTSCDDCPVGEFTGEPDCRGTPYGDIYTIFNANNKGFVGASFQDRKKRIEGEPSQRMVDFLELVKTSTYGK